MSDTKPEPQTHFSQETKWFFRCAASLAGIYLLASLLGLRDYTTVLAGTIPGQDPRAFLGLFYLFLHFIFVALVPVLVIAGTLNHLWERKSAGRRQNA